jgi:hypothetical protein
MQSISPSRINLIPVILDQKTLNQKYSDYASDFISHPNATTC